MTQLYVKMTCPYSQKVLKAVEAMSCPVEIKDIQEDENVEVLIELGGKKQVPFLYDSESDTRMYESSDIITYLCQEFGGEVEDYDHPIKIHVCEID